jgi:hypothetical protein
MNVETQTKPRIKVVTGFSITIDEKAKGSLDLIKCLNEQPEVVYFERTSESFYFIVGDEEKIREICEDFPGIVWKLEPVK